MIECGLCDHEYDYDFCDEVVCSDIIEGQYTEFMVVPCPECGYGNKV